MNNIPPSPPPPPPKRMLKEGSYTPSSHQYNKQTGQWEEAVPLPHYYGFIPWLWLRFIGYRDQYGRKAQLYWDN